MLRSVFLSVARNLKIKENELENEDETTPTSSGAETRPRKKYSYVARRINPRRKCKKGIYVICRLGGPYSEKL